MIRQPFSPKPMFKSLAQRQFQRTHRHQKNPKIDLEPLNNTSPPIITMPHLMEFTRRLSPSSSNNDNDTTIVDTPMDSNPNRSIPKTETPVLRTKIPIVNNNGNLKRVFAQKINNFVVHQPLTSIESVLKERSIRMTQDANHQANAAQRANQIFKKQIYLPFDKK